MSHATTREENPMPTQATPTWEQQLLAQAQQALRDVSSPPPPRD